MEEIDPEKLASHMPSVPEQRFAVPRGRLARLCLKELRETLRDRRTLVTLVVMPLLLYPLLSIVFERFLLNSATSSDGPQIILGVTDEAQVVPLQEILSIGQSAQRVHIQPQLRDLLREPEDSKKAPPPTLSVRVVSNVGEAVRAGEVDVGIEHRSTADATVPGSAANQISITFRKGVYASEAAADFLNANLTAVNDAFRSERLRSLGDDGRLPVQIEWRPLSAPESTGVSVAAVIPLILVLMTMTGAVYPAIDLTAGERERGTLEALVAAPVPRFTLLFAKYIAVVVVSVLTATGNLMAMSVTLYATGISKVLLGGHALSAPIVVTTMLLLILFAFFFAAVLLAATSFARSFKEAQAYLIPLTLASIGPSLCSLIPGVMLTPAMATVPLVNLVLLARDNFAGTITPASLGIVLISTVIYSVAAVSVAAHYFGSDAVLYRNDILWSDMLRRPRIARENATTGEALMTLTLLLPLNILTTHLLARWIGVKQPYMLLGGMSLITIVLFAGGPLAASWIGRLRLPSTLALGSACPKMFVAAVLMGLSLTPLLLAFLKGMGFLHLTGDRVLEVQRLVQEFQQVNPILLVMALAIVPAICEELFFRGFVYTALAADGSPTKAIFISSVLFGIFHVLGGAFAVERFLPSACVGFVLAWLRHRSGSVLPGMVLHAVHNGSIALIAAYEPWLSAQGFGEPTSGQIAIILGVSAVLAFLAAWLVARGRDRGPQAHRP